MRPSNKMDENKASVAPGPELQSLGLATAKLAHELNNPLDAVIRYISLAQRTLRNGQNVETERFLRDAQFGLQRMAEVLREMLETGRVQDPMPAGAGSQEDLAYIIQQAADTLKPQSQRAQVHVMIAVPDRIQVSVTLYQVLLNLIENAIDVAPAETLVHVTGEMVEKNLVIHVRDQGPGIEPDDLPHIFEPFFTRKPVGEGSGLGLAVCKELVTRLGGTLWAENTNPGCCFSLRMSV